MNVGTVYDRMNRYPYDKHSLSLLLSLHINSHLPRVEPRVEIRDSTINLNTNEGHKSMVEARYPFVSRSNKKLERKVILKKYTNTIKSNTKNYYGLPVTPHPTKQQPFLDRSRPSQIYPLFPLSLSRVPHMPSPARSTRFNQATGGNHPTNPSGDDDDG